VIYPAVPSQGRRHAKAIVDSFIKASSLRDGTQVAPSEREEQIRTHSLMRLKDRQD